MHATQSTSTVSVYVYGLYQEGLLLLRVRSTGTQGCMRNLIMTFVVFLSRTPPIEIVLC